MSEQIDTMKRLFHNDEEIKRQADNFDYNPRDPRYNLMNQRRGIAWLIVQVETLTMEVNAAHDQIQDLAYELTEEQEFSRQIEGTLLNG